MMNTELLKVIEEAKASGATEIDLCNSGITELPQEICQLTKLEKLRLDGNPLCCPPLEICNKGIGAMRQYFEDVENGTQLLNEVKILVVGDGEAGKTSLVKRLFKERFKQGEAATHGINIRGWEVDSGGRKIKANIWDFGGQEIQRATHQFFLSKRSLYVLVLDGRKDEKAERWLRHIKAFGGNSPVLIVTNKQDVTPEYGLDHADLLQKHPNISRFFRTSCKKGTGIAKFRKALEAELAKVEMTAIRWPKSWLTVKQRMEQMKHRYINADDYETICKEAGITEAQSCETLLEFLHDLGVVVHFKEFILDSMHVLRPDWVTNAVYRLITAEETIKKGGRLDLNSMGDILHQKEDESWCCPRHTHPFILELMRRFELCYDIDKKTVLIPQILPAEKPDFPFDYDCALRFVLRYDNFLPDSIFSHFLVKVHKDIKEDKCWRTGVLLEDQRNGTQAVVKSNQYTSRIEIWVCGPRSKEYLNFLWYSLLEINDSFAILDVKEGIPLSDTPFITADYNNLVKYAAKGIDIYYPEGSDTEYSVRELLGLVQPTREEQLLELMQDVNKKLDKKDIIEIKPGAWGVSIDVREAFRRFFPKKEQPR